MAERKPPLILLGSSAAQTGGQSGLRFDRLDWQEPAWLRNPALFDGVFSRRCGAYLLDGLVTLVFCVLLSLVTCSLHVMTLGLLAVPGFLLAAPVIHFLLAAITIGGRSAATPGMRAMGLRVVAWTGDNPGGLRGILHPAMFYMTVPTTAMLALIFAFFDPRGRCIHDHLAGVLVVRTAALPVR